MIYFDAAYVAKCYLNEPGSEAVRALARGAEGLCSCEIARAEVFATVHRHLCEGHLRPADVRKVLSSFEADEKDGVWEWLPLTSALVRAVCDSLRNMPATVFIRTGDALHLQCARENDLGEIFTNDRHVLAAARHFRITAKNIIA